MTPNKHQANILLVDDEALFRQSVAEALSSVAPSYRIHQASNGREALDLADVTPMDVIVSDISMPVMNGIELMLELRRRDYAGALIVVTAFGNPRVESQVTVGGAFSYLEKPVDLPQMIEVIRNAAEGERSHIQGLTLTGFIQLLSVERKTCRLRVSDGHRHGDLLFRDGQLVDARLGQLEGDRAALELIGWDESAQLDLHSGYQAQRITVNSSLNHLLLEAMRLKDEAQREPSGEGYSTLVKLKPKEISMGNVSDSLKKIMEIEGAIGVALVDHESGMSLGQLGGGERLNLDVAGAGNTAVVRSKLRVMNDLGLDDNIEDILISLSSQYHLIRPLANAKNLFLYLALDRSRANLAMARHKLMTIEKLLAL